MCLPDRLGIRRTPGMPTTAANKATIPIRATAMADMASVNWGTSDGITGISTRAIPMAAARPSTVIATAWNTTLAIIKLFAIPSAFATAISLRLRITCEYAEKPTIKAASTVQMDVIRKMISTPICIAMLKSVVMKSSAVIALTFST